MTRKPRTALLWLRNHGPIIAKDAQVQTADTGGGSTVTFNFSYDGARAVRLTFSNVTPEERKDLLTAWLNGELPGLKP